MVRTGVEVSERRPDLLGPEDDELRRAFVTMIDVARGGAGRQAVPGV